MPGRFDRVWSELVERATVAAIVDGGMTAPKVARLALDGQLPHPEERGELVPAPKAEGASREDLERRLVASARRWAADERRRRQGDETPAWITEAGNDQVGALTRRIIAIAASEVDWISRQRKGARDLERLRKAAQVAREAGALVAKKHPGRSPAMEDAKDGKPPAETTTGEDHAAAMIARMNETAKGAVPRQDDPKSGTAGVDTHERADENKRPDGQQDETEAGGINGRAGDAGADVERRRAAGELGIDLSEANGRAE
jgi:hypothetical protein